MEFYCRQHSRLDKNWIISSFHIQHVGILYSRIMNILIKYNVNTRNGKTKTNKMWKCYFDCLAEYKSIFVKNLYFPFTMRVCHFSACIFNRKWMNEYYIRTTRIIHRIDKVSSFFILFYPLNKQTNNYIHLKMYYTKAVGFCYTLYNIVLYPRWLCCCVYFSNLLRFFWNSLKNSLKLWSLSRIMRQF